MIQEDSYYKNQDDISFDERVKVNYDHPNAFDTDLLIEQLGDLLEWKAIDIPVYDYVQHTRSKQTVHVEPKEVIIVEGILVLNDPRLRDLMDIKILSILMMTSESFVAFSAILKNAVVLFNLSLISICQRSNRCITSLSNQRSAMPTSSCRKAAKIRLRLIFW